MIVTRIFDFLSFLSRLLSSWIFQKERRRTRLFVILINCSSLKNLNIHHISHHFVYHCCSIRDNDHVSKTRLLHNFRKRRIFTWVIVWTDNFMQDRRITFAINNDATTINNINVDISQSFFVFFILYLFYNADFLKLLKRSFRRIAALSFVNDINILTYEFSITSNCRILKEMHAHCETYSSKWCELMWVFDLKTHTRPGWVSLMGSELVWILLWVFDGFSPNPR
jgi:hypothetical protein